MKKVFSLMKKIAPAFMVMALVFSVFNFSAYDPHNELTSFVPSSAAALALPEFGGFGGKSDFSGNNNKSESKKSSHSESQSVGKCSLKASAYNIVTGSDLTLSWEVSGLTDISINGEKVEGSTGQKTFKNIQEDTIYTLSAKSADGNYSCVSTVEVTCLPTIPTPPTCTELGYDLEVARFDWKNNSFQKVSGEKEGFQISVSGDNGLAKWSSNKGVSSIIASASGNHKTFNGGTSGEINKCNIPNGCSGITSLQFCGYYPEPEPEPEPEPTPEVMPMCTTFTASAYTLPFGGGEVELKWTTKDATKIVIDNGIGEVSASGNKKVSVKEATTYTLIASEGDKEHDCYVSIDVEPEPVIPTCDLFSVSPNSIVKGNTAELSWKTSDAKKVTINNGVGEVDLTGKFSVTPLANTKYILTAFGEKDTKVSCEVELKVTEPPVQKVPMCTTFTATPFALPYGGGEVELKWTTKDATRIVIDNGVGEVSANGSKKVSVKDSITYTLIASEGDKEHDCYVSIDVEDKEVTPTILSCELTPSSKTVKNGEEVTLAWTTKNAVSATLTGFGNVEVNGNKKVQVNANKTFTLEVKDVEGKTISCNSEIKIKKDPVTPPETKPLTCADNTTLSLGKSKIKKGESTTLTWTTKGGVTAVSFDQGITATNLSGSVSVSPATKTTYTMTVTDGKTSVDCPVTLDLEAEPTTPPTTSKKRSGGSSSVPTCKLEASKTKIKAGEEVKLTWTTSRNDDLILKDGKGEVLVTTKDLVGNAKYDILDNGSKIVKPVSNITYTLVSEKGSRETVCAVKIEVEKDTIVVSQIRDQQPLIAGISLSEVPYTGFEAGPILTAMFYMLLAAWALYIAYAIVARKRAVNGMIVTAGAGIPDGMVSQVSQKAPSIPEMIRPDVFVASVKAPEVGNLFREVQTLPENLPIGVPTDDFGQGLSSEENSARVATDNLITQIENYAHSEKVLISSDAIRYFIAHTDAEEEKMTALSQVLASAKTQFPAEDGWIVVNEQRMRDLCLVCAINQPEAKKRSFIPTILPEGSGSLAEAIVAGNISAAYSLLENNPMFSLADAASDLDSVYRQRKGQEEVISTMLVEKTKDFSDEKLMNTIKALTSALDGTYTDELSAVKMAVLKAVKIVKG